MAMMIMMMTAAAIARAAGPSWKVSRESLNPFVPLTQNFISDKYDLRVRVTYSGYTVKSAKLWDFSSGTVTNAPDGVSTQELTAHDRDKADRIIDVLLGNARRF